jgi:prevent-host-death family protein
VTQVNLYEAKTQLSKLVDRAAAGEDIVIAKNGEPVAVLVAPGKVKKRVPEFGFLKGQMPELTDEMIAEGDAYVRQIFEDSLNAPIEGRPWPRED